MLSLVGLVLVALLVPAPANSPLADAAMKGERAVVESLLAQKADVNAPQGDGSTALHWAAFRNDVEMAGMLVKAGASLTAATRNGGWTPLFMAAKSGNAEMLELLVKAGADVNSPKEGGATALMFAAASGKPRAVEALLKAGADVNAKDKMNHQTALMFAASTNAEASIKLLANHGADLNAVSRVLDPTVEEERDGGDRRDQRRARGPWLGGLTALHFAAREGNMEAVRALVEAGADLNVVASTDKMSAMTMSIINGYFTIAKFMLEHGANPNLISSHGLGPLFAAIDQGWAARTWYPPASSAQEKVTHLELMEALLKKGADPNAKMGPKLWFRTFHGDWVDPDGATPFWRAAQSNDIPAMKLLVAHGADPKIPTAVGGTALQVAAGFGYQPQTSNYEIGVRLAAVKYLVEEHGLDVNATDRNGFTPLHGAALMNDRELVDYLIGKGANAKARANRILGRNDDTADRDVNRGFGDTVADMANGPRETNLQYPEMVKHLISLGSELSDNCRAVTCVQQTRPDRPGKQ